MYQEQKMKTKRCKRCGRELEISEYYFPKDIKCIDGFRNVCKECKDGKFGYPRNQKWTEEDNLILRENYFNMSNKDLVNNFFPTRTERQVGEQATKKLGLHKSKDYLRYKSWTKEQIGFLIDNYPSVNNKDLSLILDKSEPLIIAKAIELGIRKDSWWTDDEEQLLIEKYPYIKTEELVEKYFSERGFNSVINKVRQLGLLKDKDYLYQIQIETGMKNLENVPDMKGNNSPRWVERIIIKCDQCGIDIPLTPNNAQDQEHYFCSRECFGKWRSENLCGENNPAYGRADEIWTPEMRLKAAENAVIRLKELNFSSKPTKPQLIINNLLNELEINYDNEYDCKYYLVDNYLIDYNLMIEVQGNYFHCNPVLNLENSRKTKIIGKDKSKHTYIKRYKDIEVLYLWEKDIIENVSLCEKLILKYIENKGLLENYHSFNYYLYDNELELIENLYVIGY